MQASRRKLEGVELYEKVTTQRTSASYTVRTARRSRAINRFIHWISKVLKIGPKQVVKLPQKRRERHGRNY